MCTHSLPHLNLNLIEKQTLDVYSAGIVIESQTTIIKIKYRRKNIFVYFIFLQIYLKICVGRTGMNKFQSRAVPIQVQFKYIWVEHQKKNAVYNVEQCMAFVWAGYIEVEWIVTATVGTR